MEEGEGGRGTQAVRILLRSSEGVKGREREREEARQSDRQMAMAFARARKIRLAATPPLHFPEQ